MQRISQLVAVLLLVVAISSFSFAQIAARPGIQKASVSREDTASEVAALLKQFLANVKDPSMHERFWADDLVYVSSAGKIRAKSEVVNAVRMEAGQPASPATSFAAEDVTVRVYGSIALVNFTLVAREGPPAGPRHEGETLRFRDCGVFQRNKAGWQAVSWQSTFAPQPPKN
jgi:ketosteroid isomerase-like protein